MDRTERDQTPAVLAGEFPDETVHVLGEAHHLGSDVVDQARSLHAGGVEVTQERAGIVDQPRCSLPFRDLRPEHLEDGWLQRPVGLDMDVDVRDSRHGPWYPGGAESLFALARTISSDSGVFGSLPDSRDTESYRAVRPRKPGRSRPGRRGGGRGSSPRRFLLRDRGRD